jgi:hypothetical protein
MRDYKKIINLTKLGAGIFLLIYFTFNAASYNFEYVNVTSTVNITNAYPEVLNVKVPASVTLNAGTTRFVYCNVTIRDWNGYDDIVEVNATIWENNTYTQDGALNNNSKYFNSTCTRSIYNGFYANYSCGFDVWYYANASTKWICNVSVIDKFNFTGTNFNITTITPIYAINVTPIIDYGEMVLSNYSINATANITNIGNSNINVSVYGYGGKNPSTGAGLAMTCQNGGNITINNERFSASITQGWASKIALSGVAQNISNLTVQKRMTTIEWNTTYWQLYTDPTNAPFGICNGTVVFAAEIA